MNGRILPMPIPEPIPGGGDMPDVRVAVKNIRVPVAEPEPRYTGRFLRVELAKPAYAPGERIRVICEVEVTRTATPDPTWSSEIRVHNLADGRRITEVRASHVAIPWRDDTETWDTDLDLGPQPEGGLHARLSLWAGGSPMHKVAEAPLRVGLPGEWNQEPARPVPWLVIAIVVIAVLVLLLTSGK